MLPKHKIFIHVKITLEFALKNFPTFNTVSAYSSVFSFVPLLNLKFRKLQPIHLSQNYAVKTNPTYMKLTCAYQIILRK